MDYKEFRIWDVIKKKMMNWDTVWGSLIEINIPNKDTFTMGLLSAALLDGKHKLIVQQSTGLKDVNGETIWEGNILESGYNEKNIVKGPVVFKHAAFYFMGNALSKYVIIEKMNTIPHLRKLGNIFENPEMMQ